MILQSDQQSIILQQVDLGLLSNTDRETVITTDNWIWTGVPGHLLDIPNYYNIWVLNYNNSIHEFSKKNLKKIKT